jgi:hypothetical protein
MSLQDITVCPIIRAARIAVLRATRNAWPRPLGKTVRDDDQSEIGSSYARVPPPARATDGGFEPADLIEIGSSEGAYLFQSPIQ